MKRIGVVGCGYVFDHYMATIARHAEIEIAGVADIDPARLEQATRFYELPAYPDVDSLLADPSVEIVANFTPIEAHYEVTRAALQAGKHVYSEKPFAMTMEQAHTLVDLAADKGLRVSCAPSNVLSATSQSMWKAVTDGAVGDVLLAYAEVDDNPIYLMKPEGWRSLSGAPWPYIDEYQMGSTWEHVGYHLTWMCAIFGPVRQVIAFSKKTVPHKTGQPLRLPDTPDFSVACLDFESGVAGRVTCSITAPLDHRMRIIGNMGMIHVDTHRHYEAPVRIERFTALTLNARKARSVRTNSFLQRVLGVNGRQVPLVPVRGSSAEDVPLLGRGGGIGGWLHRLEQRQLGREDKAVGLAELAAALEEERPHFPAPDFTLHLTELVLTIQGAGPDGVSHQMATGFTPLELPAAAREADIDYRQFARPSAVDRFSERIVDRMHKH